MQTLSPSLQEPPHGSVGTQRRQQLDVGSAGGDHRLFDSLCCNGLTPRGPDTEQRTMPLDGGVEIVHRYRHVIEVQEEHGVRVTDRRRAVLR